MTTSHWSENTRESREYVFIEATASSFSNRRKSTNRSSVTWESVRSDSEGLTIEKTACPLGERYRSPNEGPSVANNSGSRLWRFVRNPVITRTKIPMRPKRRMFDVMWTESSRCCLLVSTENTEVNCFVVTVSKRSWSSFFSASSSPMVHRVRRLTLPLVGYVVHLLENDRAHESVGVLGRTTQAGVEGG